MNEQLAGQIKQNYSNNSWMDANNDPCPGCPRSVMGAGAQKNPYLLRNIPQRSLAQRGYPTQQMISAGDTPNEAAMEIQEAQMGIGANMPTAPSPSTNDSYTSPELPGLTAIGANNQPTAINLESLQYLNGFLLTQIGKKCRVEFLVGGNVMGDRTGTLVGVGANYILLNEFATDNIIACDFYSIKFVTFFY